MQLLRAQIGQREGAVTSAGPAMKPLVPLSRQIRISDDGAGDAPPSPIPGPVPPIPPIPPIKPCKLDFREGCYQINFTPTASLVTFEGTLRVDRSAPDGGADNLIVSGDLYTRRPVIGPVVPPVTPVPPVVPPDADEDEAPSASAPMSVAGALSAVDAPVVPLPVLKAEYPDLSARPLSLVSQGHERLGAGVRPGCGEVRAHDHRRAVQLHAAAGRVVQGHIPEHAVPHRDVEALESDGTVPVLPDRRTVLRGPAVRRRRRERRRHPRLGVEVLPSRDARNRHAGGSRPPRAGT